MGVTIHYHGGLDDPAQLEAALLMLREECERRGWAYRAHDFEARGTFETYSVRSVPGDLPGLDDGVVETDFVELDTRWRGLIVEPHPESESLVLMFDPSNGRYLDIELIEDGRFLIDFNYAYNPYCAYNDRWSCPLPPQENRLGMRIQAGEKKFKDAHP